METKVDLISLEKQLEKLIFTKEEFQTLHDYCSNRNYGEEAVAVYLMLEDLTEEKSQPETIQSGDPMFNFLLAKAASELLVHVQKEDQQITELDVAKAFELLAEKYFSFSQGTPK
ncbi:hypothetical protein GW626_05310 [Peribacillus muralis]|uniref:hypothetical protein n=1 Tax=Peribacillus muralis TaxID=264697 RepID=UPI001F4D762F|nr:hypothetical protein [Peribacillus muralis]MCK1992953.1 hypothetical protein [Peribacillus muralis]MCK2013508.1 hypothetical protein [Peribacillus muralis]